MFTDEELASAMRVDLERRVTEISRTDARAFGHIGPGEWVLAVLGGVVVPLILWWRFG